MAAEFKVVDASAVAALLFGEPSAEKILQRLGGATLVAPSLMRYEVGSVCLKKLDRYGDQSEALLEALGLLDSIEIQEMDVTIVEAARLAADRSLTIYDAAYLEVAQRRGLPLATLDDRLRHAAISTRIAVFAGQDG